MRFEQTSPAPVRFTILWTRLGSSDCRLHLPANNIYLGPDECASHKYVFSMSPVMALLFHTLGEWCVP